MLSKIRVYDPGTRTLDPRSRKKYIPDPGRHRIHNTTILEKEEEKKLDERSVPTTRRHWAGRKIWLVRAGESITSFKEYFRCHQHSTCLRNVNYQKIWIL
jgi:hypothetical protein